VPWKFWKKQKGTNTAAQNPVKKDSSAVQAKKESNNPCLSCGACCAFSLVSFPAHETDQNSGGVVPIELTVKSPHSRRCMKGTDGKQPRCIALDGFIGTRVFCRIYGKRPSTCRNFLRSWEDDVGNLLCDRARAAYGLQVFSQY
jgi:Fe-S-cluster containining protein